MCAPSHPAIPRHRPAACASEGGKAHTALLVVRVFVTLAVAMFLLIQLPSSGPQPEAISNVPLIGSPLTFRTDATESEINSAGAQLLESYGSFAVARGFDGTLSILRSHGRYAEPFARASELQFAAGAVDVSALRYDSVPWTLDSIGMTVGVIHFVAPIKSEWREQLASRGLALLRYVPQDGFVVRGRLSDLQSALSVAYVDWVGPYESAWKIRPGMPTNGVVNVRIVVLPGESPETIEAWLGHAGIPADTGRGTGPVLRGVFGTGDFRWVLARIPASLVSALANQPAVEFIDPVQPVHPWNAETDWVIQTNLSAYDRYWTYGLNGSGQVIGMADTGLDYDGAPFRQSVATIAIGDIYNTTDPSRRKVVRYVNMGVLTGALTWPGGGGPWDPFSIKDCADGHGTGVASTLAGYDNPTGGTSLNDGNALGAKIYLEDVGGFQGLAICPNEGLIYIPENYNDLFGPAGLVYNDPAAPVRIHSDSWGADTNVYDVQARMVDAFVWAHPDMTIVFAAGNAGSNAGTVGTPATAKDVVAVGGAYNPDTGGGLNQNDLAPQSSRGPTTDGRIKPTIVTIFDGDSAMSDGSPSSGTGLPDAHWAGTSYSTPAAAAAAAIIRQYFVDGWYPSGSPVANNAMNPSAALLRAILIASGQQVTGSGTVARSSTDTWPNNEQGFGRVLLSKVLPIAAAGDAFRTQVVDGTAGLLTGDDAASTFHVGTPGPAKFVLTWNDYPGTIGATKALVNDLDLEVTAPDGTVYRGNHFAPFAQGQSLPGGIFDTTNVEEAVILRNAAAGDWSVRVIGSNIPVGPQPFAFVATGNLDLGYGRLSLDRVAYSEADTIRISAEDTDATSVIAHVASGIEPAGEDVTLTRGGPDETWHGSIATAFGTPTLDGVLQVREGDVVTATYQDPSPPHTAMAKAKILASGPTIHDVSVTAIGSTTATVQWTTVEPATTEVRYGINTGALTFGANTSDLRTGHTMTLTNLQPETRYYLEVTSRGRLANATTDTNGGADYQFETSATGDVLLVVGGSSFPPEREASYAAALRGNGWTWSLWRVAELGLPPLPILQARRAVIWQVGLEQYPPFNVSARALVQSYLDGGGRLIVSSHDSAWALGSTASAFATAETEAWVRSVLKATFVCDPLKAGQMKGVSSDPISGSYVGGVLYTPHRDGGADDQLSPRAAGGTTSPDWRDSLVQSPSGGPLCAQNQPVGLRWVSSSSNGTSGQGTWGGRPSRLAYFAFEITGLDSTATNLNPASPTRAAIVDAALRWLVSVSPTGLDRDHPDVNITSPNGGVFSGPSIPVIWTATAYGTGVVLSNFTLDSSADGGLTWTPIATLPGSARNYTWDIGTAPNGNRYLLRILSQDNGTPSLSSSDITDASFAIARPGGDMEGPILWAGSVRMVPRPPGAALLSTFNATADDRSRGGSAIAAAELFLQMTPPTAVDAGTGVPMSASDGSFDGSVENIEWQGALAAPPGVMCAWVHAEDVAGNWGPYTPVCFVVIYAGPDTVAPVSASPMNVRLANSNQDLDIGWRKTWDEGRYGGTTEYRVFRATSPRGPYVDVSGAILGNGSAAYEFVDPGRAADASDYFYRVETIDAANNMANSTSLAVKVHLAFAAGLNLLGMSIDLTDPTFGDLAAGRAWADAWTYDACAAGFGWSSALPSDPSTFAIPKGRGFWLNGTAADTMTVLGLLPGISQIHLCGGWNLVSLSGFASGTTVRSLKASTGADVVMGFDPAGPYHVRNLSDTEAIATGAGYWIRIPVGVIWTVPGW